MIFSLKGKPFNLVRYFFFLLKMSLNSESLNENYINNMVKEKLIIGGSVTALQKMSDADFYFNLNKVYPIINFTVSDKKFFDSDNIEEIILPPATTANIELLGENFLKINNDKYFYTVCEHNGGTNYKIRFWNALTKTKFKDPFYGVNIAVDPAKIVYVCVKQKDLSLKRKTKLESGIPSGFSRKPELIHVIGLYYFPDNYSIYPNAIDNSYLKDGKIENISCVVKSISHHDNKLVIRLSKFILVFDIETGATQTSEHIKGYDSPKKQGRIYTVRIPVINDLLESKMILLYSIYKTVNIINDISMNNISEIITYYNNMRLRPDSGVLGKIPALLLKKIYTKNEQSMYPLYFRTDDMNFLFMRKEYISCREIIKKRKRAYVTEINNVWMAKNNNYSDYIEKISKYLDRIKNIYKQLKFLRNNKFDGYCVGSTCSAVRAGIVFEYYKLV